MARLVSVSGLEAAMGSVQAQIEDIAEQAAYDKASAMCAVFNYQLRMIGMEIMHTDKNQYYDPKHADLIESHLLRHFSEVISAVVEDGDSRFSKRIVIKFPDMEISDNVRKCVDMAVANAMNTQYAA